MNLEERPEIVIRDTLLPWGETGAPEGYEPTESEIKATEALEQLVGELQEEKAKADMYAAWIVRELQKEQPGRDGITAEELPAFLAGRDVAEAARVEQRQKGQPDGSWAQQRGRDEGLTRD